MQIISYFAGTLALMAYLPQTIKTIRTRHTKDLSLPTFLMLCSAAVLWTIYGIGEGIPAIWVTNSIIAIFSIIILTIKIKDKD